MQSSRIGACARLRGDRLDQVEKGWLAPVDVVEDDHERPAAGELLEEPADRPRSPSLARDGLGDTDGVGHAVDDQVGVRRGLDEGADLRARRLAATRRPSARPPR